jgi:hypothetical protein
LPETFAFDQCATADTHPPWLPYTEDKLPVRPASVKSFALVADLNVPSRGRPVTWEVPRIVPEKVQVPAQVTVPLKKLDPVGTAPTGFTTRLPVLGLNVPTTRTPPTVPVTVST